MVGCSVGGWIAAEMATKAPERFNRLVMVGPVGVKVGPPDKLDIPDIFAMPQAERAEADSIHDPARMAPDPSKMTDDELAVMFRNRETLALLVWEPWMHNPKLKQRLHRDRMRRRCSSAARATASSPRNICEAYARLPAERAHA